MSRFKARVESLETRFVATLNADELDLSAYRKRLGREFDVAISRAMQAECVDEFWNWLYDSAAHGRVRPVHELDAARFPKIHAIYKRI